jgi:hypothetical protein
MTGIKKTRDQFEADLRAVYGTSGSQPHPGDSYKALLSQEDRDQIGDLKDVMQRIYELHPPDTIFQGTLPVLSVSLLLNKDQDKPSPEVRMRATELCKFGSFFDFLLSKASNYAPRTALELAESLPQHVAALAPVPVAPPVADGVAANGGDAVMQDSDSDLGASATSDARPPSDSGAVVPMPSSQVCSRSHSCSFSRSHSCSCSRSHSCSCSRSHSCSCSSSHSY